MMIGKWVRVIGVVLLLSSPIAKELQAKEPERDGSSGDLEVHVQLKGVYFEEYGESGLNVKVWSASGKYSRKGESLELDDVKVLVPSGSGPSKKMMELKGKNGNVQLDRKLVIVRGDVQVLTEDGYNLETDEAAYNYESKEIEGSGPVLVTGPDGKTKGVGFHVNVTEKVVLVRQSVETILEPEAIHRAKEKLRE